MRKTQLLLVAELIFCTLPKANGKNQLAFVERSRVMLTSRVAYKNSSALQHCLPPTPGQKRSPHLHMLLQLRFMLARELLVLPLKLCDQELPLDLLFLLEGHKLLLKLMLTLGRVRRRQGELVIYTQVHGDGRRRHLQWQRHTHINCGKWENRQ